MSKSKGLLPRSEITDKLERADTLEGYKRFLSQDLVMNKMQAWNGVFGFADSLDGIVSPDYSVFRVVADIDPRFFTYLFKTDLYAGVFGQLARGMGTAFLRLNTDAFGSVDVPLPTALEQRSIANFLDKQTARIDALIAEKQRLASSVREHEQAQISSLLTAGVDAPVLVPTGRDFIPAAPKHWRVVALKRALRGLGQGWSPQCDNRPAEPGEWGVLKVGCVNGTTFDANENKALPSTLEPDLTCVLKRGDVLVSRANTRELVGSAALVDGDFPNLLLCDKLYRLDLREDWVLPEFAVLVLRSDVSRRQIELGAGGASSSMQNISQDVLRDLVVALPPVTEQDEIVTKARQMRLMCGDLVQHVHEHIDRLREYRSSLISAAVTGQLDIGTFKVAA